MGSERENDTPVVVKSDVLKSYTGPRFPFNAHSAHEQVLPWKMGDCSGFEYRRNSPDISMFISCQPEQQPEPDPLSLFLGTSLQRRRYFLTHAALILDADCTRLS